MAGSIQIVSKNPEIREQRYELSNPFISGRYTVINPTLPRTEKLEGAGLRTAPILGAAERLTRLKAAIGGEEGLMEKLAKRADEALRQVERILSDRMMVAGIMERIMEAIAREIPVERKE